MNPTDKEFDRKIRQKMERFSPGIPTGLWEKIEAGLDDSTGGEKKPVELRAKFSSWWGAAAAVLLVGLLSYWLTRPVDVIYLRGKTVVVDDTAVISGAGSYERRAQGDTPTDLTVSADVPHDGEMARQAPRGNLPPTLNVREEVYPAKPVEIQDSITPVLPMDAPDTPVSIPIPAAVETRIADVPDLQPPIVSEDAADEMLASGPPSNPLGVSRLLNFLVGTLDTREEKAVTFSSDNEGSLKIEFNLARNRKRN